MATPEGSNNTDPTEDQADREGARADAPTQRARRRQERENRQTGGTRDTPAEEVEFEAPPPPPTEEELREEDAGGRPEGFVSLGEESEDSDHSSVGTRHEAAQPVPWEILVKEQRELRTLLIEQQARFSSELRELIREVCRGQSAGGEHEARAKRSRSSDQSLVSGRKEIRLAPRSSCETQPSTGFRAWPRDVARVTLSPCESKAELMAHIDHQEAILTAYGMGDYSSRDGTFKPHGDLEVLVLSKLSESLKEVGLASEVRSWIREQRHPTWSSLKEMLKWRHCRRHHLQEYLQNAIAEFHCINSGQTEEFLAQVRRAYNLLLSVHPNDISERKGLVRQAVGALPNMVKRDVIKKLQEEAREQGDSRDWEEVESLSQLESAIREAALADETAYQTRKERKTDPPTSSKHQGRSKDHVRAVNTNHEALVSGDDDDAVQRTIDEMEAERRKASAETNGREGQKTSASARSDEREQFAKGFGLCLFVTAPWKYKEGRVQNDFGCDGLLAQTDKKGRTYYLLGYENRAKGSENNSSPRPSELYHRPPLPDCCQSSSGEEQVLLLPAVSYVVKKINKLNPKLGKSPAALSFTVQLFLPGSHGGVIRDLWVRTIADHGAGQNYLILSSEAAKLFCIQSVNIAVTLADGGKADVLGAVTGELKLFGVDGQHVGSGEETFLLLRSSGSTTEPVLLLGRGFLDRWCITTVGARKMFYNGNLIYTAFPCPTTPECLALELSEGCPNPSQLVNMGLPYPIQDEETVRFHPTHAESQLVQKLLKSLEGTRPMALTPDFRISLRQLKTDEIRDTPEQSHTWEIHIPETLSGPVAAGPQYGKHLYDKLQEADRLKFDSLVQEYLDSGWWFEAPSGGREVKLPPSQVFLLTKAKKPRLVIDCRPLNKLYQRSSSPSLKIWILLMNMRMLGPQKAVFVDVKAAFYRVRQEPPLVIVGKNRWITWRMPFGVKWGPAGLFSSLGLSIGAIEADPEILELVAYILVLLFVDDLILAGSRLGAVLRFIIIFLRAMGFAIALKKFKAITSINDDADLLDIGVPISDKAELLSCELSYVHNESQEISLCIDCCREPRLSKCRDWLDSRALPTKAVMYSLAGNLSYDPLRLHPVERRLADEIRSATAGWPDWSEAASLTGDKQKHYQAVMAWMAEVTQTGPAATPGCKHTSPLYESHELLIEAFSDASLVGSGFAIYCRRPTDPIEARVPLWLEAWRQKHPRWHSNRRELAAALRCVQATVDLLKVRQKHLSPYCPSKVLFYCDNKSTVQWSNTEGIGDQVLAGKAVERRALARHIFSIQSELRALRCELQCPTEVVHVEGASNHSADWLSRLGERLSKFAIQTEDSEEEEHLTDRSWMIEHELYQEYSHEADVEERVQAVRDEMARSEEQAFSLADGFCWALSDEVLEGQFPTTDILQAVMCQSPIRCEPETTLADRVARSCRSLHDAALSVARVRAVLYLLKGNAEAERNARGLGQADGATRRSRRGIKSQPLQFRYPETYSEEDVLSLARAAQGETYASFRSSRADVVQVQDDVAYMSIYRLDQTTELRPIIPLHRAPNLVSMLIGEAHRAVKHGSADATIAEMHTFYVEGLRQQVRGYIDRCVGCQVVRARQQWGRGIGSHSYDMKKLIEECVPYTVVYCDFLALGGHRKVFTTVCLATGATEWVLADAESVQGAIRAYHTLVTKIGHAVKYMHVDTASYFQSDRFKDSMTSLNVQVVYANTRSPWMQGKVEKIHDLGLKKIRALFLKAGPGKPSQFTQTVLDYVTLLLNTRPVGARVSPREEVVTHDYLVRGYTRPTNPYAPPELGKKLAYSLRSVLMESRWSELKLLSQKAGANRSRRQSSTGNGGEVDDSFVEGDLVLVRYSANKYDNPYRLGRVKEMKTPFSYVVEVDGTSKTESVRNLVKLRQ